jgi:hypothetical protein
LLQAYGSQTKLKVAAEIQSLLIGKQEPSDEVLVRLILAVNARIVHDGRSKGLFLVLDELGKFLEFAALHPERQDVFILQRLAEIASRSADEPIFLVCLLHQGFNAYADHLNQSAQREWEKVAGRFDEIVFNQPVEQLSELIVSALNVNTKRIHSTGADELHWAMEQTIRLGWFGSAPSKALLRNATRLYPLHPTVLPALVRVFRRFGQNERSLFSFLLSNEPFGLQAFSERRRDVGEFYRLHNFYDYVRANFGHRLSVQSYRSYWNLIDSVVESFATEDELPINILKTTGILNLLNDSDLLPTAESVTCSVSSSEKTQQKKTRNAVEELNRVKRAIYDRGPGRGLCLWPHTSVDLEKAYDDARRAVEIPKRVADHIKDFVETRPIVARRHYIETGNLRYYSVRYCSVDELQDVFSKDHAESDGVIVIPLCETVREREVVLEFVRRSNLHDRPHWLVAVPQPLSNLSNLIHEVQRWEWIATNTLELNADRYAREEVSRQSSAARSQLSKRVEYYVGFTSVNRQMGLEWFHKGSVLKIRDGRDLMSKLSRIFDDTYPLAPRIHNELVNRRTLSSAAAAARMRLIERMFSHEVLPYLGLDPDKKPPEMSMYLSVLKNTGLHQQQGDGWIIGQPDANRDGECRVLPALERIRAIVQQEPDSRVSVAALFEELRKPPYGMRDGLIPLLLTTFAIAHQRDVALYKDGSFLRELAGEAILLLTKAPERFEIQYCRIEGVRAELFSKLLSVLELKPSKDRELELLDVVKNLCSFVAQLPGYVRNTSKLPPVALAVRKTILDAREPAKLLFTDLPLACGFDRFLPDANGSRTVQTFLKTLRGALDELRAAYPELQERLRKQVRLAFDSPGPSQHFRSSLASRAERVLLEVTEPKLRAFCLRLMNHTMPESEWLESLGSYLALKPPAKWHDSEEDLFNSELIQFASRFHRVESIVFSQGNSEKMTGVRLAITQANGVEHEQVVLFSADEESQITQLQTKFDALLLKDKRIGLAAASRAIWMNLAKEGRQ